MTWISQSQTPRHPPARRGMVLLIVLVVIVLLSLGAYTFSEFMLVEAKATRIYGRTAQTRALADSGAEMVAALVAQRTEVFPGDLYHNPTMFQGVVAIESESPSARGRISVVAPVANDPTGTMVRFGVMDESGKLNLNLILERDIEEGDAKALLLNIPGMTYDVADAILDWVDEDEELRPDGAENEYYMTLSPPYETKNARFDTLEELLLVRGVTPELLYGEDANRNGLLDREENDGEVHPPFDNADDVIDRGWSDYLTVDSRETNYRADGSPRIHLNTGSLDQLFDELEMEFSSEIATFVVAYRINGPLPDSAATGTETGGTSGGAATGSGSKEEQQLRSAFLSAANSIMGREGTVTRGGMDLAGGGSFDVNSLFDLVGARVQAAQNGTTSILESPWPADPAAAVDYLPEIMDAFSTAEETFIEGRTNINQAPFEVLITVPGMTAEMAEMIVGAQNSLMNGETAGSDPSRQTTGWLWMEGLVDLEGMREMEPFITSRGDVFRAQIVGHYDQGGPLTRIEVIIDATENPAQITSYRDLTDLGRGFRPEELLDGVMTAP